MSSDTRSEGEVTRLLIRLREGDREALDRVIPIVYEELRRIAHRRLSGERLGRTLGTTGLIHEAFLRLVELDRIEWRDRAHFLAISARLMRRILIDYALAQRAAKRGGDRRPVPLEPEAALVTAEDVSIDRETLIALDRALDRLAERSERQARVVEHRFFAGMDVGETAEALHVSSATVKRDWAVARAWLHRELGT
ncbi:MAG: ECF-type sigma factor [Gemmatimonadota bacterium]|nr:ECF-type sigma factor [Gemmatimonadota bacterium]